MMAILLRSAHVRHILPPNEYLCTLLSTSTRHSINGNTLKRMSEQIAIGKANADAAAGYIPLQLQFR